MDSSGCEVWSEGVVLAVERWVLCELPVQILFIDLLLPKLETLLPSAHQL